MVFKVTINHGSEVIGSELFPCNMEKLCHSLV